jgi:hypothetical protein
MFNGTHTNRVIEQIGELHGTNPNSDTIRFIVIVIIVSIYLTNSIKPAMFVLLIR